MKAIVAVGKGARAITRLGIERSGGLERMKRGDLGRLGGRKELDGKEVMLAAIGKKDDSTRSENLISLIYFS